MEMPAVRQIIEQKQDFATDSDGKALQVKVSFLIHLKNGKVIVSVDSIPEAKDFYLEVWGYIDRKSSSDNCHVEPILTYCIGYDTVDYIAVMEKDDE
jgi:hypothetical protein